MNTIVMPFVWNGEHLALPGHMGRLSRTFLPTTMSSHGFGISALILEGPCNARQCARQDFPPPMVDPPR